MSDLVEHNTGVVISLIGYWAKKFRLGQIVIVLDYQLTDMVACVGGTHEAPFLRFNPNMVSDLDPIDIMYVVFHELGHIKKEAYYDLMSYEDAEYLAEKQALIWLKRYQPKIYKEVVKRVKKDLWADEAQAIYCDEELEALRRIKDYQI